MTNRGPSPWYGFSGLVPLPFTGDLPRDYAAAWDGRTALRMVRPRRSPDEEPVAPSAEQQAEAVLDAACDALLQAFLDYVDETYPLVRGED